MLNGLQADFDSFRKVGDRVDPTEYILDRDAYDDADNHDEGGPERIFHLGFHVQSVLVPDGDRAGDHEAEGHGGSIIGEYPDQEKGEKKAAGDPEKVS